MSTDRKSDVPHDGAEFFALNGGPVSSMSPEQKASYETMMRERAEGFQKTKNKPGTVNKT
jgi:hypothetical protein